MFGPLCEGPCDQNTFGIFWKCSLKYFEIFWAPRCVWASLRGAVCDRIVWYSFGIFCKCSLKYFEIFWAPRCVWASLRGAAAPCGRNEAPGVEPAHYLSLKIQIHPNTNTLPSPFYQNTNTPNDIYKQGSRVMSYAHSLSFSPNTNTPIHTLMYKSRLQECNLHTKTVFLSKCKISIQKSQL